jgi:hypothetical protein
MSDTVPHIDLGLTANGDPVVLIGTAGAEARDMATLLRLAPGIALPAHAIDAASLVNHLAHGAEYRVIGDPNAYRQAYEARLASEDPNALFQDGVHRLRDFGVPNFADIKPPRFEGSMLVFFAADKLLGVPYRVTAAQVAAAPVYTPLPLTPLEPAPHVAGGPAPRQLTPAEQAERQPINPGDLPR